MKNDCVISILMATYNGDKYIRQQLDSIFSQTYENWVLYISDDGSTDDTIAIIHEYMNKVSEGKIVLLNGPRIGFAGNFFSLLHNAQIISAYYAFCDQDDIWVDTKLDDAVSAVNAASSNANSEYILYGSRTYLIDSKGNKCGASPCFQRSFGLQNALVQSYSGGNTMLFSRGLKKVIETFPADEVIVSHDWFLYLICSALGGEIIYDENPKVLYRQHDDNLVGSNLGINSKLTRLRKIYGGDFKRWNAVNEKNLSFLKDKIAMEQRKIIASYYHANSFSAISRIRSFIHAGVYRQSVFETMFFMIMSFMGKLGFVE